MRIPCIKCGHLHDSTVTPFMYDNIKADHPNPNPDIFYNVATGSFKCINCGTKNKVKLVWGMWETGKEDKERALKEEEEWAKAHKLKKAITNTGTVHYVTTGCWQDGKVEPFCNCRSWVGDYWGKKWDLTDKPVTCKNCLSSMHRMMKEEEKVNEPEGTDQVS